MTTTETPATTQAAPLVDLTAAPADAPAKDVNLTEGAAVKVRALLEQKEIGRAHV